ncbi:hypothetical protein lerEdw1_017826 [Lerista edwardsae]|nr:hypothetical protein lerEdw1_017826 [Lerista edwardsae]
MKRPVTAPLSTTASADSAKAAQERERDGVPFQEFLVSKQPPLPLRRGTPSARASAPTADFHVSPTHASSAWARAGQEAAMTRSVSFSSLTEVFTSSSPVSRVVYNGKRNSSPRSPSNSSEIFTPAHEENVRFIYEAWQCVERDLRSQMAGGERGLVEEYVEKIPNPSLKAFKPVDLSDLKRRNTQDAKKS